MTDLTPDQEAAFLNDLADVCRSAGYRVEAIDRGLEVSGEDEEDGAFYLLPDHGWLQARCLVLDPEDLDEARDLTALFETAAKAQFRLIGSRFGFKINHEADALDCLRSGLHRATSPPAGAL